MTVGHASRHTAAPIGPSTIERSSFLGGCEMRKILPHLAVGPPTSLLLERVAGARIARVEAALEPRHALLGRSVRELLGHHAPRAELLQTIVANRRRGAQPLLHVARIQL